MYVSSVEGTNMRGRPLGRWEDRMKGSEGKWVEVGKKEVQG